MSTPQPSLEKPPLQHKPHSHQQPCRDSRSVDQLFAQRKAPHSETSRTRDPLQPRQSSGQLSKALGAKEAETQRSIVFTNFNEISYAFFTNAVLKYRKSAEATADRRES